MSSPSVGFGGGGMAAGGPLGKRNQTPEFDQRGYNAFGVSSPMRAMAGDDAVKQRGIMDYYNGMVQSGQPGGKQDMQSMQAQAAIDPNSINQAALMQRLRDQLMQKSSLVSQINPQAG